ncbi:MAG: succinylglutamate desuccinylase/aspartoacylase family protein [Candidatus Nanosalina sp.]
MKVIERGESEPEIAVVACVHGDEKCGKKAIEEFLESDVELQRPVKFVIANEKAMEAGERFVDTDLNRCFPGDPESKEHEERLAAELLEELKGCRCLALHSMENFEEMFCLVDGLEEKLVESTGLEKAVEVEPLGEESLDKYLNSVSVETGETGSNQAVENSIEVMVNFLKYFDVIPGRPEVRDFEVFEIYTAVDKPDFNFVAENFRKVVEGEIYAEKGNEKLRAGEDFYPVLMGDSYSNIIGFKGRKGD